MQIFDVPYRWRKRPIENTKYVLYNIKSMHQRATRGWADRDTWNIDCYLAEIMPPMLRHFKETSISYPGGDITEKMWDQILLELIEGFEAAKRVIDDDYCSLVQPGWFEKGENLTNETIKKSIQMSNDDQEIFKEKMTLFVEYFFALWN